MSNIVWVQEDEIRCHAIIGQYEDNSGSNYVFGVIYFGFPLDYGWDVRVGKTANPDSGMNFVVYVGDNTDDLEQAKREAERIGKEWIKGDSPIWAD